MLKIIQVGHNDASDRYIRNKIKAIEEAGMQAEVVNLDENCTTDDIKETICDQVIDIRTTAILVQLPLPDHIDKNKVLLSIPTWMDIDGLNPKSNFKPLTPCAIMRWLEERNVNLYGATVAIFGRSELVGKPLANMLIDAGATVTVMNSKTEYEVKQDACKHADIIVSAVGKIGAVGLRQVYCNVRKPLVIDVGINKDIHGHLCGDVDDVARKWVEGNGGYCTPVPGGVGKWTVKELVLRLHEMEDNKS